ncbi:hypothetical protein IQ266_19995 [filamentous cyanobacterium LEGE 11480]|uniref:Uncharacterized protein n=1 Tax=Romeriopsis navalis LEGE 11480 TaxID=2777977 RepID=A0A928VNT5_9CYAN|nr:hypothetical protein [Romeriopsis navalis]MBE9032023.1 hypothetical protein [Romeriopsis navalis LEGE 11480]
MSQYERLVLMAEDELVNYSSEARKVEKLRRKIGLSVSAAEQKQVKEQLEAELSDSLINRLLIEQRQAIALPFWGIAGLGLLFGISFMQPIDLLATVFGGGAAIYLQKLGWKKHAKHLALQTLVEIEERVKQPTK